MKTEEVNSGWFPMSEAPKDGTPFLAYLETDCGSIRFLDIISYSLSGDTVWENSYADEVYATPLCWRQLPDVPDIELLALMNGSNP